MFDGISNDKWKAAAVPSLLKDGEVDIWRVDLDIDPRSLNSFFELLSDDEKRRADKFVFARDRNHFIAARGTLRKLLGGYLGKSPEKICFEVRKFGKPDLSGEDGNLRFNLSHSNGIAAIAVAMNREVGVDIEFVNNDFDIFRVAQSAFSTEDVSRIETLPSRLQATTFFSGWTRKEAFLKAMGDGLSSSEELQSAVSFIGDEDISYRSFANDKIADWSLTSFDIQDGFKAALAVEGNIETVRFWQMTEN
ncbi:MAG: 4'-phosphopantetheinyl transferase family protein [Pyrinomonadaceae bacterium]